MNQRYYDLTTEQKLALSQEDFMQSIKLEAVHRGHKIPLNLSDVLKDQEFTGFQFPADAVTVYQVCVPDRYSSERPSPTGLCYKTEEEAKRALSGSLCVVEDGYGAAAHTRFGKTDPSIILTYLSLNKPKAFHLKLETLDEPTDEFDALCEECSSNLSELRQSKYNAEVLTQKKKTYMTLAKGDEEIAKAFWAKVESGPFPLN